MNARAQIDGAASRSQTRNRGEGERKWPTRLAKGRNRAAARGHRGGRSESKNETNTANWIAVLALAVSLMSLGYTMYQGEQAADATKAKNSYEVAKGVTGPSNEAVTRRIAASTSQGTNYTNVLIDPELRTDVSHYLNQLEHVALQVNAGVIDETIVFLEIGHIVFKNVKAHLFGESGALPSGKTWYSNAEAKAPFASTADFPELRKLFIRWFPQRIWVDVARS